MKYTKTLCALLACMLLLAGCNGPHRAVHVDLGFVDKKTDVEYTACNVLAVKPITVEDVYCEADDTPYYQIQFEDPARFLCDYDQASGSSIVYRNKTLPDITIENFGAVAAFLYLDGKTPVKVGQLYADDEYLPDELKGQNPSQDTDRVNLITNALIGGEERTVPDSDYVEDNTYYFRLLSPDYPGLYYSVCFFGDRYGRYYLEDMGTFKIVDAPSEIVAWIIGSGD